MVLVAASLDNKDQLGNTLVDDRSKIPQVYGRSELFPDSYGDSDILLTPKLIYEMKDGGIATTFGRAIIMPNLKPPITTVAAAIAYHNSLPPNNNFTPLMTLHLTDNMSPDEIKLAKESGAIFGVKLYPAGATTNSDGRCDRSIWKMHACP